MATSLSGTCQASVARGHYYDIAEWDVSSVLNISPMFYDAKSFNAELSKWDVSSVTHMHGVFRSGTCHV